MLFRLFSLLILGVMFFLTSCASEQSKMIVAEFNDEVITTDDFTKAYKKNELTTEENNEKIDDSTNVSEFIDLYSAYKMKLKDAELRGFPNEPEIINEINSYRKEVGEPYYLEKYVKEPGVKSLYERRKSELRLSHIMIKADQIGRDSAKALASTILAKALAGEDYNSLASKYSDDEYTKNKGGDIYYITAGQIIPEFEKAAYACKVGEIYPELVETSYGFHVMKLTEKHPRKNRIRASHILIKYNLDEDGRPLAQEALDTAKAVKKLIDEGADFAQMAKKYSDDKSNASKGGDLNYFARRTMVQPFDSAAFSLKVGKVSDIVKTKFGYHIIKLTDIEEVPSFESEKENLTKMYERFLFKEDKSKMYDSLAVELGMLENFDKIIDIINSSKDTVQYGMDYWGSELQKQISPLYAFKIGNTTLSSDSLFKAASEAEAYKTTIVNERSFTKIYKAAKDNALMEGKINNLQQNDSTFAQLMEDYTNGIYIFRLQESEVWNKLVIDSTKLLPIYNETKDDYQWDDRVSFVEVYTAKEDKINELADSIAAGCNFEELASKYSTRRSKKATGGVYTLENPNSSEMAKAAFNQKEGQISKPMKVGAGWAIIKTTKVDPARQKTFEEAMPQVISVFQGREAKRLEEEYINRLKEKFSLEINYEQAQKAIKNSK